MSLAVMRAVHRTPALLGLGAATMAWLGSMNPSMQQGGNDQQHPPAYMHYAGRMRQQAQQQEFRIQNEDFPSLGGGPSKVDSKSGGRGGGGGGGSTMTAAKMLAGGGGNVGDHGGIGGRLGGGSLRPAPVNTSAAAPAPSAGDSGSLGMPLAQTSSVMSSGFGGAGLQRVVAHGDAAMPHNTDLGAAGRWGLLGLLGVIRMESTDINMLALGDDLTTLGLNLNATDVLYASFESPWVARRPGDDAGGDNAVEDASPPPFSLPRCYKAAPGYIAAKLEPTGRLPRNKVAHYGKFQAREPPVREHNLFLFFITFHFFEGKQGKRVPYFLCFFCVCFCQLETLFYIFYGMPRDLLALYAAQELYVREWQYHKELKLWFTRATQADGMVGQAPGGQYIYFDVNAWERRLFTGIVSGGLQAGFMRVEELVIPGGVDIRPESDPAQQAQAQQGRGSGWPPARR